MSRPLRMTCALALGFPRVSGDEPAYRFQDKNRSMFSPRERG